MTSTKIKQVPAHGTLNERETQTASVFTPNAAVQDISRKQWACDPQNKNLPSQNVKIEHVMWSSVVYWSLQQKARGKDVHVSDSGHPEGQNNLASSVGVFKQPQFKNNIRCETSFALFWTCFAELKQYCETPCSWHPSWAETQIAWVCSHWALQHGVLQAALNKKCTALHNPILY